MFIASSKAFKALGCGCEWAMPLLLRQGISRLLGYGIVEASKVARKRLAGKGEIFFMSIMNPIEKSRLELKDDLMK